jgi:hypothetical protein
MFGRTAPQIEVPAIANWRWMIEQFANHPELENWIECLQPSNGLINAEDGAMVLLARSSQPAHCGVWLMPEKAVLHCDDPGGVMFQTTMDLRANGWQRLKFYGPR